MSSSCNMSSTDRTSPNIGWEDTPSYIDFTLGSYHYLRDNIIKTTSNFSINDFSSNVTTCLNNVQMVDLYVIIALTVGWTFLRRTMTTFVFHPMADRFGLEREEKEKLPESAWKCFFYSLSFVSVTYVLFIEDDGRYFRHPTSIWTEYSVDSKITSPTYYIIFAAQTSFYVHSLYATLFLDSWRKDSIVLLVHHVIATILFTFSWSARYHRSALIVVFLHDACDVFLEGTKSCFYLKTQEGKNVKVFERAADAGFLVFTIIWAINRLYLYPLRLMYFSTVVVDMKGIDVPFGFLLNSLMYLLLAMNVYWFTIILNVLRKVVMDSKLEDVRDYEELSSLDEGVKVNKSTLSNGILSKESLQVVKEGDRQEEEEEEVTRSGKELEKVEEHLLPHQETREKDDELARLSRTVIQSNASTSSLSSTNSEFDEVDESGVVTPRTGYLLRRRQRDVKRSPTSNASGRSE